MGFGDGTPVKGWTRDRLASAARAGVVPDLDRLSDGLRRLGDDTSQRLTGLHTDVSDLAQRVAVLSDTVVRHSPRPQGRPEFLARYHLSDVLAWRAADSSAAWAEEHLLKAAAFPTREAHLRAAARLAPARRGSSWNSASVMAKAWAGWRQKRSAGRRVVGFDSFEGLPEDWRTGFERGAFDDLSPDRPGSPGELVVGWFDDTLPEFLSGTGESISLLHVDCDLYSSTVTVLAAALPHGSRRGRCLRRVLQLSRLEPPRSQGVAAAAVATMGLTPEYVGYVPSWEQVSARL